MWSIGIVLCCVYLLKMTSCERDFKLLNVDRCSNGTIHFPPNGAADQVKKSISISFTSGALIYVVKFKIK